MRLVISCLLLSVGCGATTQNVLRTDGFYNGELDYRIRSDNEQGYGFISSEWQIDNFTLSPRPPSLKSGPSYRMTRTFDVNDDGRVDKRERGTPIYDLRLVHVTRDATLWVRSMPLPTRYGDRELRVLARSYVDAVAGADYVSIDVGGHSANTERRHATRTLSTAHGVVAEREAFSVVFDVANVDQRQISSAGRFERVRIVLIRTNTYIERSAGNFKTRFPVILIAGYANLPEDFERDEASFEQLLRLIEFRAVGGYPGVPVSFAAPTLEAPPSVPASPAPAPAPAPTPNAPPATLPTPETESERPPAVNTTGY